MLPSSPFLLSSRPRVVVAGGGGGNLTFGWVNYSNLTANNGAITSFTVGTTNANTTNGSIAQNDLLIMVVVVSINAGDPGSLTPPGGWTQITNTLASQDGLFRYGVWWKLAGASEGGTYSVTWSSAARGASWLLAYYTSPATSGTVEANASQSNGSYSTNVPALTVTPTASDDMLICIGMSFGGTAMTAAPSGMTSRALLASNSSEIPDIALAELQLSSNSATGTKNFTAASSIQSATSSLAVKHA